MCFFCWKFVVSQIVLLRKYNFVSVFHKPFPYSTIFWKRKINAYVVSGGKIKAETKIAKADGFYRNIIFVPHASNLDKLTELDVQQAKLVAKQLHELGILSKIEEVVSCGVASAMHAADIIWQDLHLSPDKRHFNHELNEYPVVTFRTISSF